MKILYPLIHIIDITNFNCHAQNTFVLIICISSIVHNINWLFSTRSTTLATGAANDGEVLHAILLTVPLPVYATATTILWYDTSKLRPFAFKGKCYILLHKHL